jgi:DNA-binding NarL/FixJ family response regulator
MNILMVDDHKVIVSSLAQVLEEEPDIESVYCAGDYESAVVALGRRAFDVAVVDVDLPTLSGLEFSRLCLEEQPECRIVILTGIIDRRNIERAMQLGVHGYLVKTIDPRDLVSCLRLVYRGINVLDAGASALLGVVVAGSDNSTELHTLLSPQQLRVLKNVARGMTNKEVAREMGISEKTARNYLASVFEKLGLQRRAEAAVWYARNMDKLTQPADPA